MCVVVSWERQVVIPVHHGEGRCVHDFQLGEPWVVSVNGVQCHKIYIIDPVGRNYLSQEVPSIQIEQPWPRLPALQPNRVTLFQPQGFPAEATAPAPGRIFPSSSSPGSRTDPRSRSHSAPSGMKPQNNRPLDAEKTKLSFNRK